MPTRFRNAVRTTAPKPIRKARNRTKPSDAEQHIEKILLKLLDSDQSPASRIAAAKILLGRMSQSRKDEDEAKRRKADESEAAIAEAYRLLEELAAAKFERDAATPALDQDSAPEPADAAR